MQRQTPQRRAILSAVSAAQSPLTAEQVHTEVCSAFPRLALTTVYRSLDAYVDAGLCGAASMMTESPAMKSRRSTGTF